MKWKPVESCRGTPNSLENFHFNENWVQVLTSNCHYFKPQIKLQLLEDEYGSIHEFRLI